MNDEDRRMIVDERDASPERSPSSSAHQAASREQNIEQAEPIGRTVTSSTSTSGASSSIDRVETSFSRIPTVRDTTDLRRHPTALSRIQTARSQHTFTVGESLRSRTATRYSKTALPNFGAGKPYPPLLPERDEYVVEFDGPQDPLHAQNWPLKKKLPVAITLGFVTLTAAFGSAIFSASISAVGAEFGLSREVGILGVSLYVLGFATGPIFWAPFSELYGRRIPLLVSSFGFSIFNVAVGAGKDAQTIFLCR